jgi:hypothetical protein
MTSETKEDEKRPVKRSRVLPDVGESMRKCIQQAVCDGELPLLLYPPDRPPPELWTFFNAHSLGYIHQGIGLAVPARCQLCGTSKTRMHCDRCALVRSPRDDGVGYRAEYLSLASRVLTETTEYVLFLPEPFDSVCDYCTFKVGDWVKANGAEIGECVASKELEEPLMELVQPLPRELVLLVIAYLYAVVAHPVVDTRISE